jgi:diguanylate cyclase (GGDEF)-like protein
MAGPMDVDDGQEHRRGWRRLSDLSPRARLVMALALTSAIPILALFYVHVNVILNIPAERRGYLPLLLSSTGALIIAGSLVIWDLSRDTERANRRWQDLSLTDELTGAHNRRYFLLRLNQEIARATRYRHPLCLVLVDIDHFKDVNDRHGHHRGDDALKEVCRIVMAQSRVESAVCRFGGDEFAVLLPEASWEGGRIYAERIRAAISLGSFAHGGPVTISVGVAAFPDDAPNAEALFTAADTSLYSAKAAGRNQVGSAGTRVADT